MVTDKVLNTLNVGLTLMLKEARLKVPLGCGPIFDYVYNPIQPRNDRKLGRVLNILKTYIRYWPVKTYARKLYGGTDVAESDMGDRL